MDYLNFVRDNSFITTRVAMIPTTITRNSIVGQRCYECDSEELPQSVACAKRVQDALFEDKLQLLESLAHQILEQRKATEKPCTKIYSTNASNRISCIKKINEPKYTFKTNN
ncbi:unnamed protein product [Rotaria sp. Silwood1]|nr:unnamed protein product [Rotaria sp. Silwood1]